MKVFFGFVGGTAILLFGNAVTLVGCQLLFNYAPYWLASIGSVIFMMVFLSRAVGLAFYKFPYVIVGVGVFSLYQTMFWLLTAAWVVALFNHEQFNNMSSMPKWLYIFMGIYYIIMAYSYRKDIREWLYINY